MKKRILKISIIVCSLAALNMPFFLLAKRDYISQEQPDFSVKFENYLDLSEEKFFPKKQILSTENDNLNGISLLIFNNKLMTIRGIELLVYPVNDFENPIVDKGYKILPDYFFSKVTLRFDQTFESSKNKEFLIVAVPEKYDKENLKNFLKNDEKLLNIRPTYGTSTILKEAYYRTSQYKPTILKNPTILVFYLTFNIVFLFLIIEILKNKQKQ